MSALDNNQIYPRPREDAERIIALGEELLQKSTDASQREYAIQILCYTYESIDNEKALYYADMGGSLWATKQSLRAFILNGEEGVEACQNNIAT